MVDGYYTPGGNVTNGFDIQTPSAAPEHTSVLSSDYTRADGSVFTGAKGGISAPWLCSPLRLRIHMAALSHFEALRTASRLGPRVFPVHTLG